MPFEVPDNWEWVKISDIAISIQYGYTGKAISNGKYKMLRITDIQNNYVDWSSVPFVEIDDDKADNYLLYDGDILFARTGATVGKSFLIKNLMDKSVFASYLIRINSSKKIHAEYIKFFFESNYYWEQIIKKSLGTGQPNVNGTILGSLAIPLPPLSEQKRLVSKLEQLFELIDFIEQNKLSLNQLIAQTKNNVLELAIRGKLVPHNPNDEPASLLLDRISKTKNSKITTDKSHYAHNVPDSWIACNLYEVCDFERGVTFPASAKYTFKRENHIACIRTANVQEKLEVDDLWYIDRSFLKNNHNKLLRHNDIIISSANSKELVGKTSFVEDIREEMCFGGFVMVIRTNIINSKFLFYYLRNCFNYGVFSKNASQTTNIANINATILGNLIIQIPPIAEQQRIVEKVEEIFKVLDYIQENLRTNN